MPDRRDKPELLDAPPGERAERGELQPASGEAAKLQDDRQAPEGHEPPVVARLIVEIRSDGSRTIARGAIEDTANGQRTTLEARGDSPIQLAMQLARAITQLPRLGARSAMRGLLGRRRDK